MGAHAQVLELRVCVEERCEVGEVLPRHLVLFGVRVVDEERGEPGELRVRSAQASLGFFGDPERTAAAYEPDGWVRTGDLATIDERGYLTIVGRKKEIIIRGGINIAPREIEDLVAKFPEVARAAVVGLPHPRLGDIVEQRIDQCLAHAAGAAPECELCAGTGRCRLR